MDLVRVGLGLRALRRRRGWRQRDVAVAARVGQTTVSLVERGHADRVSFDNVRAIAAALDARLVLQLRWRAGDLDRLLDADHATVSAAFVRILNALGWAVRVEVTYSSRMAAGSIDILAWHPRVGTLLVVEVKTEIPSVEATLRKLDEKVAIAPTVALDRLGWRPSEVSRLLVIEESSTNRRRVDGQAALFDAALPAKGSELRQWLREPVGRVAGRMFLSPSSQGAAVQRGGGRHRVRRRSVASNSGRASVNRAGTGGAEHGPLAAPTVLVGYERSGR